MRGFIADTFMAPGGCCAQAPYLSLILNFPSL